MVEVAEIASIEIGVTEKRRELEPKGGFYAKSAVLRLQDALGDPDAASLRCQINERREFVFGFENAE